MMEMRIIQKPGTSQTKARWLIFMTLLVGISQLVEKEKAVNHLLYLHGGQVGLFQMNKEVGLDFLHSSEWKRCLLLR